MGRYSKEKRRLPHAYAEGNFNGIHYEVLHSDAYAVLKNAERLVLLDMIRVYNTLTHSGKRALPEGFFVYTFGMSWEHVGEGTFYRAIRRICEVGFFDCPIDLQKHRPGAPKRYARSSKWRAYEMTAKERDKLQEFERKKRLRVERGNTRRRNFTVEVLANKNNRGYQNDGDYILPYGVT